MMWRHFLVETSKNLLRGPLAHLRFSLYTSKAAILGAPLAPLATFFRGPLVCALAALAAMLPNLSMAQASAIPFKHESASGSVLGNGAFGVLVISLLVIVAVFFIRKQLQLNQPGNGASRHLRILETQRIGPKALLSVIEFDGARYLIAQSEHGIQCLLGGNASKIASVNHQMSNETSATQDDVNIQQQEGN